MKKKFLFSLTLIYLFSAHADSGFRKADENLEDTLKTLRKRMDKDKTPLGQSKNAFALGVYSYRAERSDEALDYFIKSLELGTRLGDYAHYFSGLIYLGKKDYPEAKKHFQAVVKFKPQSVRKAEAELQLANIARQEEKWGDAIQHLRSIEKKYRRDIQYPEILYSMFEAAKARNLKNDACVAATKLYTKFPMFTVEKAWSEDLTSIGCSVQFRNQEKRFTQLLLTGEFDRCKAEIKFWTDRMRADGNAHPGEMSFYETQLGRIDLAEGKIGSAIGHFLTAQDMKGKDFNVLMYLGKAYSQTEDYNKAIDAYTRAYEMHPRSKLGQQALFQAAFLSYQNLDYDGAARRFEDLSRKTRGKLLQDTKWHLAWIRYLKEDYEGAVKAFTAMSTQKKIQTVDLEKLSYWRAMSLMRLGFIEDARETFKVLSSQKRLGYYTAAAQARLAGLPPERKQPEFINPNQGPSIEPAPSIPQTSLESGRKAASEEDSLSTPHIPTENQVENGDKGEEDTSVTENPDASPDVAGDEGEKEEPAEEVAVTTWKDPMHALRFDRARDLMEIGFDVWARAELREIEKRTRNLQYLQLLMSEYARVGEYNRSAYIADVAFAQQREKLGISGAAQFWNSAFPQAYGKSVHSYSKKFDVPQAFVWSVMRGESAFREDIHSPAGALGLMQLIPKTGKKIAENLKISDFKREMLLDPDTNIRFGTWYLKRLNRIMAQSTPLVVASYNAGPHRVQGWVKQFGKLDMDEFIEHIPYLETRNYVKKILRNFYIYQTLYEKKNSMPWLSQKLAFKFDGPKPMAENWDE